MDPSVTNVAATPGSPVLASASPGASGGSPGTSVAPDTLQVTRVVGGFAYESVALPDGLVRSPGERPVVPTGTDANAGITPTYEALAKGMTTFLGQPPLPNWATFGQYASRNAGTGIYDSADAMRALDVQGHLAETAKHPVRGLRDWGAAVKALVRDAWNGQGTAMTTEASRLVGSQLRWDSPAAFVGSLGVLPDALLQGLGRLQATAVAGNEGIIANVGPAFNTFLLAESRGQDGLAALRAAGYVPGSPADPQGFLMVGFSWYQQARALGQQAQALPPGSPRRQQLLSERAQAVNQGNLYLGIQEQLCVLQPIFDRSDAKDLFGLIGNALTLEDPNGPYKLLPRGGSWLDFATRMGFVEAPADDPGAITVRDAGGVTHHYKVPSPPIPGTISDYFLRGLDPRFGPALVAGKPAPLG